jgi:hypothetical protein
LELTMIDVQELLRLRQCSKGSFGATQAYIEALETAVGLKLEEAARRPKSPEQEVLEDVGTWRLQGDAVVKLEQADGLGPQRFLQAGTLVIPPPVSHRSWFGVPVFAPVDDAPARSSVDISLTINGPGGGSGGSGMSAAQVAAKKWVYPMRDTYETDKDYAQRCKLEFGEWFEAHGLPKIVAWAHDGHGRVDVCHALIKQLLVNAGLGKQVEHYTIPLVAADLQQLTQEAYKDANLPPDVEHLQRRFAMAWAEMERRGFQYGPGALEHVQMGFMMAHGVMPRGPHD